MELDAAIAMRDLADRVQGLELRLDLLAIDVRDLVALMRDEPSLVARRPHLAREMAAIEARLKASVTPKRPWWQRLRG